MDDFTQVGVTLIALAIPAVCFGMWQHSAWAFGAAFSLLIYWNYSK